MYGYPGQELEHDQHLFWIYDHCFLAFLYSFTWFLLLWFCFVFAYHWNNEVYVILCLDSFIQNHFVRFTHAVKYSCSLLIFTAVEAVPYLSIWMLMDIWVVFHFWLLRILLIWWLFICFHNSLGHITKVKLWANGLCTCSALVVTGK